jgi:hypothetical protein
MNDPGAARLNQTKTGAIPYNARYRVVRYSGYMTAAQYPDDLHRLVDRLSPIQAGAVRAVVLQLVGGGEADDDRSSHQSMLADEPVRTFSFAGMMQAEPDLAERSEDILRAEFGKLGQ